MSENRKNLTGSRLCDPLWQHIVKQSEELSFDCRSMAFTPSLPVVKNLLIFRRDGQKISRRMNIHGHYTLWICLAGSAELLVDGILGRFYPGDAVFVLPGQPHLRLPTEDRNSVNWLLIRFDSEDHVFFSPFRHARFHLGEKNTGILTSLLSSFSHRNGDPQSQTECGADLLRLLTILYRDRTTASVDNAAEFLRQNTVSRYIRELCELLVQENQPAADPFQIVAARWSVTPEYLRGVFRKFTGKTPRSFLQEKHLALARHLLETSELSVSEIALRCGFSGLYSFSRFFSKQTGVPPTIYRREKNKK